MSDNKTIWTIGHSTRTTQQFIELLTSFDIELLVDIRRFPGSARYPHFNREALAESLAKNEINYLHIEALGGRRRPLPDSINMMWRNSSFRGYADYMQTPAFKEAIIQLETMADNHSVAYMCAEAVWWRCHRALVSDILKARGWTVLHIMDGKVTEHPYTSPVRATQGRLFS